MDLYVVVDFKGHGRLVGVFDDRKKAERLTTAYPAYYKLYTAALNRINEDALGWVDDEGQRRFLEGLMASEGD
ncbi:MAG: hypothetical protein ACYS47_10470 [Planctomycetota bacterium]|jgi:hypothetical protein